MGNLIVPSRFDAISRVRARSGADAASRAAFCQAMGRNSHARAASLGLSGGGGGGGGGSPALVRSANGYSNHSSTTFSPTTGATAGVNNLLLVTVASGGYLTGVTAGWTLLSTDGNLANHGSRVYGRKATGDASDAMTCTMAGSYNAGWTIEEWSGIDLASFTPLSTMTARRSDSFPTWDPVTPTAGKRFIWCWSSSTYVSTAGDWSNPAVWGGGFTGTQHAGLNAGGGSGPGIDPFANDTARRYEPACDGLTAYTPTWTNNAANQAITFASGSHVSHMLVYGAL